MRRVERRLFWLVVLSFTLVSCGGPAENTASGTLGVPPQMWGDLDVIVETRPVIARVGMNEFLVIVTQRKPRKPVFDLLVSIRMIESDPWRQSIQDGHVGVYRRSLQVTDPTTQAVLVRLERGEDKVELRFPLRAN